MDASLLHSIWTVLMFLVFIGICLWAWSSRRTKAFDDAARLPFDDDSAPTQQASRGSNNHG